ncbi:hypothetical protein HY994_02825 [Candidatus Micrarchaeota archaeon]|nr:hypothetical protein [Candidatus Micrarchaeota archaeon]
MADDHGHGGGHDAGHGSAGHGKSASGGHGNSHGASPSTTGKREPLIFALILGGILLVPVSLLFILKIPPVLAVLIVAILAIGLLVAPRIQQINEYERGVLFDFGKYRRTLDPGWHWIFPTFQRVETVDMRTQTIDIPPQQVLTKEDIEITIDAVAYFRIVDAKKAVLEIKGLHDSVAHVLQAELRTQIGKIPLQDVLEKSEDINQHLHAQLQQVENDWGIKALNVELTDITLPKELENAFRKKQEALEYKDKLLTEANARRDALNILTTATNAMTDKTMTYLYMETLKKVADGRASKILYPLELTHLATALSRHVSSKSGNGIVDEEKLAQQLVAEYLKNQGQTQSAPQSGVTTSGKPATTTHTTTADVQTKDGNGTAA